jgi:hypothetical protein
MFDTDCNICREHGNLVPATVEFCVQREDDPEAKQFVRCCDQHQGQGEMMAELMKRNMSPAVISRTSIHKDSQRRSASL